MSDLFTIFESMSTTTASETNSWLRRFIFRFAAAYLIFYNLPFPLGLNSDTPTWAYKTYAKLWQAIVPWVSEHLLRMGRTSLPDFINSDAMGGWVRAGCCLALSVLGALVWVFFDRHRRQDGRIHQLVRVYVRYVLAAAMLSYGLSKVVGMQFPFPDLSRLQQTYAETSPTSLLWTFMGYGTAYSVLAGTAELAGGLLLLFQRTITLGALVVTAVMTNVIMLNFCYDVQVKLYSMHLLLFAIFLLGPDLKRLADVFVFNRPVAAVPLVRVWPARWMATGELVLKMLIVGWIFFENAAPSLQFAVRQYNSAKSEMHGIYEVETFSRDGQVVAPLLTDTNCWRSVEINRDGDGWVRRMDSTYFFGFSSKTDRTAGRLTLNAGGERWGTSPIVMAYSQEAPDRLRLVGKFDGAEISLLLRRVDEEKLPLLKRKFRWTR